MELPLTGAGGNASQLFAEGDFDFNSLGAVRYSRRGLLAIDRPTPAASKRSVGPLPFCLEPKR